jgi:hypothetical protein
MKWTKSELVTAWTNKILPMARISKICDENGFDFAEIQKMISANFKAKRDAIEATKKAKR